MCCRTLAIAVLTAGEARGAVESGTPSMPLTAATLAHMRCPCDQIASIGFMMSALPSPSPSMPLDAHVDGMNWLMPFAPAVDVDVTFQFDSASI